jgi:hypothetical protein
MHNRKIDNLKTLVNTEAFLSISFDDALKLPNAVDIAADLIFVIGYNFINIERISEHTYTFNAGMFEGDLDTKITLNNMEVSGKLQSAIKTTFNIIQEIKAKSDIVDLYPREMRDNIYKKIMERHNIDSFIFNQINYRLGF